MAARPTSQSRPAEVISIVEARAVEIIGVLTALSEEFIQQLHPTPAPHYEEASRSLEAACRRQLHERGPITGMGFIGEPSAEIPAGLRVMWWIQDGGEVRLKKHVLNPASDSYYDYNTSEWFGTPRATGKPFISAPYVDSWGTDQLTITAVVPVSLRGSFIGVVAADLDPDGFLRPIERLLLTSDRLTLVDSENRVILSSLPVLTSGVSLDRALGKAAPGETERATSPTTNWQVLDLPDSLLPNSIP